MDRQALSRATDSSDAPPPGYLFNDIAKSASSSPAAAQDVATYLVRRLNSKNNPTIKYKCLKVIQMVAENPLTRGGFKRALVQDSTAVSSIKACLGLRGPPDAVHGDSKFEKVRNQAKETLDAIYSDDPVTNSGGMGSMSGGGYGNPVTSGGMGGGGGGGYGSQGYGSNNLPVPGGVGGMGSTMGGPKKMEGIGNPMFADPRMGQDQSTGISNMTVGEVLKTAKEGFKGMIKDPLARNVPGVTMGANGIQPGSMPAYGSSSWNSNVPPGRSELASSTNGQWTMASNRGPNAFGGGGSTEYSRGAGNVSTGVGGSWGASAPSSSVSNQARVPYGGSPALSNANSVVKLAGPTGGAVSDGSYEKNLIQELCPPGGRKAEPPSDKLASFTRAIPSLNPDLVCPALLDALEDGQPWIIRAKALCVMETTIKVTEQTLGPGESNNPYSDFFYACKDEIEPLATHTRTAVREPAKRVLKTLGLEIPTGAVAKAGPVPVTTQAPAPNLLEFDSEPSGPPQAPPNNPPPTPPSDVPPPAPSVDAGASLFGGMNVKGSAASTPAPTSPVPAPVEQDFLGSTVSNPAPVTSSIGQPDLFGEVDVKPSQPEKDNDTGTLEPASDNTSSAFTFLNSSDPTEEPTTSTKPDAPKSNFDPLMGLPGASDTQPSSSTAQMPQMTPQMAAIYQQQQQQLLMMQAQMQQMQMATGVAGNTGAPFMMPPQQNSNFNMPANVMGATGGSGAKTSFAFMEDPNKKRKEATNKKFDFVQDAMKGAK